MPQLRPSDHDGASHAGRGEPQASPPETLADLGEWELIRRLGAFAPPDQFADDAALLPLADIAAAQATAAAGTPSCGAAGALVINTDVLVEGIHFSEATTAAADVGWRATAANLSDLAAMGCTQVMGITVGLVAPASTPWPWVEGVYQGLGEALRCHGGVLLGGDCSGGGQRLLAVTALGQLPADGGPIRRGDGEPGDLLVCTGPHGLSRLGLALLLGELVDGRTEVIGEAQHQNDSGNGGEALRATATGIREGSETPGDGAAPADPSLPWPLDPSLIQRAIRAHQRPMPRFDAVRALIASRPPRTAWRVGGCDSSDGLAAAVKAIAAASDCSARLNRNALPLDPAMAALPVAERWCLGGGEDFELVLALEPAWAAALMAALPGTTVIGRLETGGRADQLSWSDGSPWPATSSGSGGFQHFG